MNSLQKTGGITAILHSLAYIFGIVMYFAVLSPILSVETSEYLAKFEQYQNLMYGWIFVAYMVSGVCLVFVALALYERVKGGSPTLAQASTVFGLIWAGLIIGSGNLMLHSFIELPKIFAQDPAQAETVLRTLGIVENGLVSGTEFIGGTWAVLVSWVALQTGGLPKALNYFGLFAGAAGVLSIIPPLTEVGTMIFAFGMIVWFIWVGIVMLRKRVPATAESTDVNLAY